MILPQTFAVHVTYTCPLACAHCCFSSSPKNTDRLDPEIVLEAIRRLKGTIKLVAFTGGEPFLLGADLVRLVREASARGFGTRIVTSAYFGTTAERAERKIREVVEAGLDELSISWDDFHEEFVKFDCVKNVVRAAKRFAKLRIAVNIVQAARSRWNAGRVRDELGVGLDDVVCESPINLTGRAEDKLRDAGLRGERYLGPCPYVLTGPTLSAKGKLLACCGVIPDTERLCIEPAFTPEGLQKALARAQQSVLFHWLYLRGPYAILQWINEHYDIPIPQKTEIGGNCEACKRLFENAAIDKILDEVLVERAPEIFGEYCLLESLGLAEPLRVLNLWSDTMLVPN